MNRHMTRPRLQTLKTAVFPSDIIRCIDARAYINRYGYPSALYRAWADYSRYIYDNSRISASANEGIEGILDILQPVRRRMTVTDACNGCSIEYTNDCDRIYLTSSEGGDIHLTFRKSESDLIPLQTLDLTCMGSDDAAALIVEIFHAYRKLQDKFRTTFYCMM